MSLISYLPQFAYLDGGTGSLVIQALLAGAVTTGYIVKTRWALLKSAIAKNGKPTTTSK